MKKTMYGFGLLWVLLAACNKQNEWLDIKPNKSDVTPATIDNYQALLDLSDGALNSSTPGISLVGMDNYYITTAVWNAAGTAAERNAYVFAPDILQGGVSNDWSSGYSAIGTCNIVLDGIAGIPATALTQTSWNNVKGSALFFRAFFYYQLGQVFMKPYDASSAATDAGLLLRTSSDINAKLPRSSVADTYQLMINDLQAALPLLPDQPLYQTRPSKQAVYALLAKIYLNQADYTNALNYATQSLQVSEKLIDFNTLSTTASKPMPVFPTNPEIAFYTSAILYGIMAPSSNRCIVDSVLYQSYATNDLRRTLFFTAPNASNQVFFKGQYTVQNYAFSGLANNEMLLIQAESYARLQKITEALAALNKLLVKRWKTGTFTALTATTAQDALAKVLAERRKELPFTGSCRWEDLRRLNKDPAFAKTQIHYINNIQYQLPPNDNRYVFPLPDIEIQLSGVQQNPR